LGVERSGIHILYRLQLTVDYNNPGKTSRLEYNRITSKGFIFSNPFLKNDLYDDIFEKNEKLLTRKTAILSP
jgi:hypothetical protein